MHYSDARAALAVPGPAQARGPGTGHHASDDPSPPEPEPEPASESDSKFDPPGSNTAAMILSRLRPPVSGPGIRVTDQALGPGGSSCQWSRFPSPSPAE
jgi:hypothetical protein